MSVVIVSFLDYYINSFFVSYRPHWTIFFYNTCSDSDTTAAFIPTHYTVLHSPQQVQIIHHLCLWWQVIYEFCINIVFLRWRIVEHDEIDVWLLFKQQLPVWVWFFFLKTAVKILQRQSVWVWFNKKSPG